VTGARLDPKRANVLYHDAAASRYDEKWSISFDEPAVSYVRERAAWLLSRDRYERVLEVGAGTGFLILNLWQAGFVGEAHATDISEGMLGVCVRTAERLGCELDVRAGDAEALPYSDGSFDLVVGHAVLHHLPDPAAALAEIHRVLVPGGGLLIAGEPTRFGHRISGLSKAAVRTTFRAAAHVPALRRVARDGHAPPPSDEEERVLRELEWEVDLHTFRPSELASMARDAGFDRVRIETEELVSSLFGWGVRTAESEARPGLLGRRWAAFAFLAYRALYRLDRGLYRVLPKQLFYNVLLYAEKPAAGG
jgi:ubiquinone/menaquinone biosynthesis C-methylase UbiE